MSAAISDDTEGALALASAIIERAVEDLTSGTDRKVREDAARFFYDGRFEVLLIGFPDADPGAMREALVRRGRLTPLPPQPLLYDSLAGGSPSQKKLS
jgi:hypothetical protein